MDKRTHHRLDLVQYPFCAEQSNGIPCDESAKRIPHDTQFCYLATFALDRLEFLFDLEADALASSFDAIVREAASVAFGAQQPEFFGRVFVSESFRDAFHMFGVTP